MSHIPFRPYRIERTDEKQTTELDIPFELPLEGNRRVCGYERTLREEIRDRYLCEAIAWLSNFSEPNRPIRAQESGSPWQTAWSVIHLINAKRIFQETDKHHDLVHEIDGKLLGDASSQGALRWLMERAQPSGDLFSWEEHPYDTALVTWALLAARREYGRNDQAGALTREMRRASKKSIGWLCEDLKNGHTKRDFSLSSEAYVLCALLLADRWFPREFRKLLRECSAGLGKNVFGFLCEDILRKRRDRIARESPTQHTIYALSEILENPPHGVNYGSPILDILPQEVRCLEESQDKWRQPGSMALYLAAYIRATSLLNVANEDMGSGQRLHSSANRGIVLNTLHKIIKDNWFADGSIFHDLHSTVYAIQCFIELLERWEDARKPLPQLYDSLFSEATETAKVSEERVRLLTLARDHELLRERYRRSELRRKRWLWYGAVIYTFYLAVALFMIVLRVLPRLQPYENILLVIAVVGLVIPWIVSAIRSQGGQE